MQTLIDERCTGAPRFTAEEEADLHRRYMAGEEEAATLLTKSILPWAYKTAKKVAQGRRWIDDEMELHSAINIGVTEALNNFRPELGRLTTYVYWRIKAVCARASHFTQLIKTPTDLPYRSEDDFGVTSECLQKARDAQRIAWLSSPITSDGDGRVGDLLYDKKASNPTEELDFRQQRLKLRWALSRMAPDDAQAIQMTVIDGMTLEEAGKSVGLTRERIRQRQQRALPQLEKYIRLAPHNEEDLVDPQGNPLQLDGLLGPGREALPDDELLEQGVTPVSQDFDEDVEDVIEEPTAIEEPVVTAAPQKLISPPVVTTRTPAAVTAVAELPPLSGPGLTDEACGISAMLSRVSINDIDRELDLLDSYYQRFVNEYQRKKQLLAGMRGLLTGSTPPPAAAAPAAPPAAWTEAAGDENEDEDEGSELRPRKTNAERSDLCRKMRLSPRPRPNTMSAMLHKVLIEHGSMSASRAAELTGTNYANAYATLHRFMGRFYKKQGSHWAAMTELEMEEKWQKIRGGELVLT